MKKEKRREFFREDNNQDEKRTWDLKWIEPYFSWEFRSGGMKEKERISERERERQRQINEGVIKTNDVKKVMMIEGMNNSYWLFLLFPLSLYFSPSIFSLSFCLYSPETGLEREKKKLMCCDLLITFNTRKHSSNWRGVKRSRTVFFHELFPLCREKVLIWER